MKNTLTCVIHVTRSVTVFSLKLQICINPFRSRVVCLLAITQRERERENGKVVRTREMWTWRLSILRTRSVVSTLLRRQATFSRNILLASETTPQLSSQTKHQPSKLFVIFICILSQPLCGVFVPSEKLINTKFYPWYFRTIFDHQSVHNTAIV